MLAICDMTKHTTSRSTCCISERNEKKKTNCMILLALNRLRAAIQKEIEKRKAFGKDMTTPHIRVHFILTNIGLRGQFTGNYIREQKVNGYEFDSSFFTSIRSTTTKLCSFLPIIIYYLGFPRLNKCIVFFPDSEFVFFFSFLLLCFHFRCR